MRGTQRPLPALEITHDTGRNSHDLLAVNASRTEYSSPSAEYRRSAVRVVRATDERCCRPRTRRCITPAPSSPCYGANSIRSRRERCLRLSQIDYLGSGGVQPKSILAGLVVEQLELRSHLAASFSSVGSTYANNCRDVKTRVEVSGRAAGGPPVDHPRRGIRGRRVVGRHACLFARYRRHSNDVNAFRIVKRSASRCRRVSKPDGPSPMTADLGPTTLY